MPTSVKERMPARKTSGNDIRLYARYALERSVSFHGRCDGFRFDSRDGVLTIRGRVPTFYLRQLLERIVSRVNGVRYVDNQIDVICSHGLSSVREATTFVHR